ncbi:MAG: 30S ribosomal protein S4 [Candidatus Paceibacterota bacterium]
MTRKIKEKKERALGTKLFLKPERCSSHKCVMIRRPYKPGQHGQKRGKRPSEYARQLQEKQKIQIVYGLTNRQMENIFRKYSGKPDQIVRALEERLDRVVFLLGLGPSPRVSRQLVSHGHIEVNGRKMNIPSYKVKEGDVISVRERSKKLDPFKDLSQILDKHQTPEWLNIKEGELKGECVGQPKEEAIEPFDINLVGEFYNR